jgi:sirohydrochlorin cobaltochelatase
MSAPSAPPQSAQPDLPWGDAADPPGRHGLLLFAHGARDPAWSVPFEAVLKRCAERAPERPMALAYLEFMAPDVAAAGAALAGRGCTVVDVVPLFLGTGGHVRKDIPRLIGELAAGYPNVRWRLQPSVGEFEAVVDAMAEAALAAASVPPAGDAE